MAAATAYPVRALASPRKGSAPHAVSEGRGRTARLAGAAGIPQNPVMTDDIELKDELRLAIEGRMELGDEMEPAVIDVFVSRIERRLVHRADEGERALQRRREHQKEMVLGSMAISVPLLAIAAIFTGLPALSRSASLSP
jgi:hypothetical protein